MHCDQDAIASAQPDPSERPSADRPPSTTAQIAPPAQDLHIYRPYHASAGKARTSNGKAVTGSSSASQPVAASSSEIFQADSQTELPQTAADTPAKTKHAPTVMHNPAPAPAHAAPAQLNEYDSLLTPAPALASSRYTRQLLLPQLSLPGQQRLLSARVLLVGLGGLGSPAALYLAAAGVGTLGFVDGDVVEESNLQRQVLHAESRMGWTKVRSAVEGVRAVNGEVRVVGWEERLGKENVWEVFEWVDAQEKGWDVVLDCSDNPATRYLVSDACVVQGVPLVSGAAQRCEGQLMVLNYRDCDGGRGPCYRCVFPRPPDPEMVRGCSEIGVLGTAVGAVGLLMANEAVRLVVEGKKREGRASMLLFNAWARDAQMMWRSVGLRGRRGDCVACGDEEVLREKGLVRMSREGMREGMVDYETWCGRREDVRVLRKEERVNAGEFVEEMKTGRGVVVDTREEYEAALGMKVKGSVNVPFSRILRDPRLAFEGLKREEDMQGDAEKVYFLCQQGNDSQIAAKKMMELELELGLDKGGRRWIGDVRGGFVALERLSDGTV